MKGRIVITILLLILPTMADSAYVEEGDTADGPPPTIPPGPDPDPVGRNVCDAGRRLDAYVEDARLGEAVRVLGMTVVPIRHPDTASNTESLGRALRATRLFVAEDRDGSVPELRVNNRGNRWVLLTAGEILLGGKQNRIVATDYLLSPRSGERVVPVYCGERRRWTEPTGFYNEGTFAPNSLRGQIAGGATQSDVWSGIDRKLSESRAENATDSLQDVYERGAAGKAMDCLRRERTRWPDDTVGLVIFAGSRRAGIEFFGNEELFADHADALLAAVAADQPEVLSRCFAPPNEEAKPVPMPGAKDEARRALEALARGASFTPMDRPGDGCGVGIMAPDGARGQGMLRGDDWIHLGVQGAMPVPVLY